MRLFQRSVDSLELVERSTLLTTAQQHSLSLQLLIRFFTGMINDQEKGTLE